MRAPLPPPLPSGSTPGLPPRPPPSGLPGRLGRVLGCRRWRGPGLGDGSWAWGLSFLFVSFPPPVVAVSLLPSSSVPPRFPLRALRGTSAWLRPCPAFGRSWSWLRHRTGRWGVVLGLVGVPCSVPGGGGLGLVSFPPSPSCRPCRSSSSPAGVLQAVPRSSSKTLVVGPPPSGDRRRQNKKKKKKARAQTKEPGGAKCVIVAKLRLPF